MAEILLVDDDTQSLGSTQRILELSGHRVWVAKDGQEALATFRQMTAEGAGFDVVVSDVRMPRMTGLEFLRAMSLIGDSTPVILMTAFGQVEDAVWAMKLGAVDFLTKPFKRQSLLDAVSAAVQRNASLKRRSPGPTESTLSGKSPVIEELRSQVLRVASTSATVLLSGPSGSGKELVAREIHRLSKRSAAPFIALNCAAIPRDLIESELFGYEKGAFSGADGSRRGLFEAAEGGTLFLDEMGDMPLPLQATLLRVLQEREVRRLGSTEAKRIDVRVVSATHRDLKALVRDGAFREDLLFRLEVVGVAVPALKERGDDILLLAHQFLAEASSRHGKSVLRLSAEVEQALRRHSWPGNVRELLNMMERAVIFARGEQLELQDLPDHLRGEPDLAQSVSIPLGTPLHEVEEILIRKTLEATAGDKVMTAKLLGVNSRTIYRRLQR